MKTKTENAGDFWVKVMMGTFAALILCIISGNGESAIALAALIHAEIKLMQHDERCAVSKKEKREDDRPA